MPTLTKDLTILTPSVYGYIAYAFPIAELTVTYGTGADRIVLAHWVEIDVHRDTTNPDTDSVLRCHTILSGPWRGAPPISSYPEYHGTWTHEAGSETFAVDDEVQCILGGYPSDGNGATANAETQTLRFTPDDAAAWGVALAEGNPLVSCKASDEPYGEELPIDWAGTDQRTDPSQWSLTAARVNVTLRTRGPYLGMRR